MNEFSNQLSLAETERLAILAEECGEVVQIVGKILRHGYQSYNPLIDPAHSVSNRQMLERELGDLLWIIALMDDAVDINFYLPRTSASLNARFRKKGQRAAPYLHHQRSNLPDGSYAGEPPQDTPTKL